MQVSWFYQELQILALVLYGNLKLRSIAGNLKLSRQSARTAIASRAALRGEGLYYRGGPREGDAWWDVSGRVGGRVVLRPPLVVAFPAGTEIRRISVEVEARLSRLLDLMGQEEELTQP